MPKKTAEKPRVVEIKNWVNGEIIARGEEGETLEDAVLRHVANRTDLGYANLGYANLRAANLGYANLRAANLGYANLGYANLGYANLRDANLRDANLGYANLRAANLGDANLGDANLGDANLGDANLPAPTAVLLAYWGELTAQLCADLMLFDSLCHPDPAAFDAWAKGGGCPYGDVYVQRAANFKEREEHWGKGQPCRPFDLMARVLAEKCPEWAAEKLAEFEAKFKQ